MKITMRREVTKNENERKAGMKTAGRAGMTRTENAARQAEMKRNAIERLTATKTGNLRREKKDGRGKNRSENAARENVMRI